MNGDILTKEHADELAKYLNLFMTANAPEGIKLGYLMTIVELEKESPRAALFNNVGPEACLAIARTTTLVLASAVAPKKENAK